MSTISVSVGGHGVLTPIRRAIRHARWHPRHNPVVYMVLPDSSLGGGRECWWTCRKCDGPFPHRRDFTDQE
jgi:hypothetical protein